MAALSLDQPPADELTVYTIGHSTRGIGEFLHLLFEHEIGLLADVRTVPRSRHNPQFNREELSAALAAADIGYEHMERLGGLRHTTAGSPNLGWRNASFRGYADYMQTEDFRRNLEALIALAREHITAIMCAEAVPWRCHRSLIGDALLVRGIHVLDIIGEATPQPHKLTPWAKVEGLTITYPAAEV